ncbi:MAG: AcrR family transcriptional regulator, partial [Gammaproteobacteria bacterium]
RGRLSGAAGELFTQFDYAGTSLSGTQERVGAHRAMICYHCVNKQGLYSAGQTDTIEVGLELLEIALRRYRPRAPTDRDVRN